MSGAPPSETSATPPSLAVLLVLRGVLVGAVLALLFVGAFEATPRIVLGAVVAGVLGGLSLAATAIVETRAESREPGLGRDLRAAALATLVAFVASWATIFQVPYTVVMIRTSSPSAAMETLRTFLHEMGEFDSRTYALASLPVMLAPVLGACAFVRLRGLRGAPRYLSALILGAVSSAPGLVFFLRRGTIADSEQIVLALAGCIVFLPLVHGAADSIERRTRELLA